jgi:hypothetical protein
MARENEVLVDVHQCDLNYLPGHTVPMASVESFADYGCSVVLHEFKNGKVIAVSVEGMVGFYNSIDDFHNGVLARSDDFAYDEGTWKR